MSEPDLTEDGKKPWFRKERRQFAADAEKFSTQRTVTYFLLLIFSAVSAWVMYQDDQSERSMVLQTIINLTLLAVGYWLGASKTGTDQAQSMSRLAESVAPTAAAAVAAATGQPILSHDATTESMEVTAGTVNVNGESNAPKP